MKQMEVEVLVSKVIDEMSFCHYWDAELAAKMIYVSFTNAGNAETLGSEILESLLKMAPTKEEEWKLKEYKDDSAIKLGPAEKFLKALLDVPFAFKRVDALLYIANFESEIEYLKKSFETLEVSHISL